MSGRARRASARAVSLLLLGLLGGAVSCRGQAQTPARLDATVDSLLPTLERLASLEAREPVRVELQDRQAMRAYVETQFAEELPPEELAGMEASYQAFGLIPDTLDLRSLLLDLYTEQVVGYYDPPTETLYIMDGVPAEQLRPVLAHELVHALQDQHADLDSLVSVERGNDRQSAAQAAIEGHATLVMFALVAEEQTGRPVDVSTLPDMGAQLRPALEAQNEQFPVFRSAPRVIRETLLFPYLRGAAFVQALWRAEPGGGAPAPFGERMPQSTEQVLHPRTRFIATRDAPTEIEFDAAGTPDDGAGPAWPVVYENTLGELETAILLGEHLSGEAEARARGWDGDRFRLLAAADGGRALVWYSVWDDEAAADAFAAAYRRALRGRPGWHGRVERLALDGRPAVRVVTAERHVALDAVPLPAARLAGGGR